jgi:hypothetical protein
MVFELDGLEGFNIAGSRWVYQSTVYPTVQVPVELPVDQFVMIYLVGGLRNIWIIFPFSWEVRNPN